MGKNKNKNELNAHVFCCTVTVPFAIAANKIERARMVRAHQKVKTMDVNRRRNTEHADTVPTTGTDRARVQKPILCTCLFVCVFVALRADVFALDGQRVTELYHRIGLQVSW